MPDLTGRHPATVSIARHFEFDHLAGRRREVSQMFYYLAHQLISQLPDDPELVAGLRKILEGKDCAVRLADTTKETP